jgi:hypothetical protein
VNAETQGHLRQPISELVLEILKSGSKPGLQGVGENRGQVYPFAFQSGTLPRLGKVPEASCIEHMGLRFFCVQTILFEILYVFFVIRHANTSV